MLCFPNSKWTISAPFSFFFPSNLKTPWQLILIAFSRILRLNGEDVLRLVTLALYWAWKLLWEIDFTCLVIHRHGKQVSLNNINRPCYALSDYALKMKLPFLITNRNMPLDLNLLRRIVNFTPDDNLISSGRPWECYRPLVQWAKQAKVNFNGSRSYAFVSKATRSSYEPCSLKIESLDHYPI